MSDITLTKAVFEFANAWRTVLDARLKPFGLTQAKWRLLLAIDRHKQLLNQKELAQVVGIEGPSIAGLIDRMSKEDWIRRQRSTTDKRVNVIKLTAKGRKMITQIRSMAEQLRAETLETISAKELAQCIKTLQKAKQTLIK
jgi:MarR family transcriptional regulator for hemolysin